MPDHSHLLHPWMADIDLESFLLELKQKLLYNHNIQQKELNRWNSTTSESFRNSHQSMHKATLACGEFLEAHHKYLPFFTKSIQYILVKLRIVFRNEQWFQTLFEETILTLDSTRSAEILKTAASNYFMGKSLLNRKTRFW